MRLPCTAETPRLPVARALWQLQPGPRGRRMALRVAQMDDIAVALEGASGGDPAAPREVNDAVRGDIVLALAIATRELLEEHAVEFDAATVDAAVAIVLRI